MTAIERVEKLKADRRAELAAAKAEEERREYEKQGQKAEAWVQGVRDALKELGEEWLLPFRAADFDRAPFTSHHTTYREAAFAVPGHRLIMLRVEDITYYDEYKWRTWPLNQNDWMTTWAVASGGAVEGYSTLADALIAAELKPGENEEPIPF